MKLVPKKQTAWGTLEYKGPQYYEVIEQMKREDPQAYNRLQIEKAKDQQSNSEIVNYIDAEGKPRTAPVVKGMSNADPIGQLYVEGVALNPVFKGLGRVAEYGLAKAGNKWARAKILSKAIDSKATTYLDNSPITYRKINQRLLPKDQDLLYHQNYGSSRLTNKGLIPGKSGSGEDYLWWKEGSQYGNFPERNVYTIPRNKAKVATRGSIDGIRPDGDYPLTKEVPLEELTEYSINPVTYGFEKRMFIKPNKPPKRLIMNDKTVPAYFGRKYSVNDVVNPDGTVNIRTAQRIQKETAKHYGVPPMQKRTENPVWHKDDPNTFLHTKKVTKNAWELPVPPGYTKQDQMLTAVGHDFGKIVAGDGHAQAGAGLLKQIFPDLTDDQFKAIYEHMNPIDDIQSNLSKYTKYADIGKKNIEISDFTDQQWDDLYNAAIKSSNKQEIQKIRDLHFKVKAPNTVFEGPYYHGSGKSFNVFDPTRIGNTDRGWLGRGYYFTSSKDYAEMYGRTKRFYLNASNPMEGKGVAWFNREDVNPILLRNPNIKEAVERGRLADSARGSMPQTKPYDGYFEEDVMKYNTQMKLANPITYDDSGNIIPISKRDNFSSPDIRYGLIPLTGFGLYNQYNKNTQPGN